MSVLIRNGEAVAKVRSNLKGGSWVRAATMTCAESLNANRELNLVNAFDCKVSHAKKYDSDKYALLPIATCINDSIDEFVIQ